MRRSGVGSFATCTVCVTDGTLWSRYSRNPDYVGQTLAYLGITIAADSWWPVILLPAVLLVIQFGVVRREEAYLEAKFGDAYRGYKKQVRRWL